MSPLVGEVRLENGRKNADKFTRWLIAKGRIEEADVILADLEELEIDDPYVVTQSKEIQWAVQYERENNVPWMDLLRGKAPEGAGTGTLRRMFLGMGTQAMQQFSKCPIHPLPGVLSGAATVTGNPQQLRLTEHVQAESMSPPTISLLSSSSPWDSTKRWHGCSLLATRFRTCSSV